MILWRDAAHTKKWWDKIRLWFMPIGWRPEDCRDLPRYRVNEKTLVKFNTPVSTATKNYLILSSVLGTGLMFITINLQWPLTVVERVLLTGLVWHMISNWGGILENREWSKHSDGFFLLLESLMLSFLTYKYELMVLRNLIPFYFLTRLLIHTWWRVGLRKEVSSPLIQD